LQWKPPAALIGQRGEKRGSNGDYFREKETKTTTTTK
jgi:hypothetical protein